MPFVSENEEFINGIFRQTPLACAYEKRGGGNTNELWEETPPSLFEVTQVLERKCIVQTCVQNELNLVLNRQKLVLWLYCPSLFCENVDNNVIVWLWTKNVLVILEAAAA